MAISRLNSLRKLKDNDKITRLETFPKIPSIDLVSNDDIVITWNDTDRLDSLAAKHLGDGRYWWVIALINGIISPFSNSLRAGAFIRIPRNIDRVLQLIKNNVEST